MEMQNQKEKAGAGLSQGCRHNGPGLDQATSAPASAASASRSTGGVLALPQATQIPGKPPLIGAPKHAKAKPPQASPLVKAPKQTTQRQPAKLQPTPNAPQHPLVPQPWQRQHQQQPEGSTARNFLKEFKLAQKQQEQQQLADLVLAQRLQQEEEKASKASMQQPDAASIAKFQVGRFPLQGESRALSKRWSSTV